MVKLDPNGGATIEDINRDYKTTTLDKLLGSRSIYLLKLGNNSDTEGVAEQMGSDPRLIYAEPNFTTHAPEGGARHRAYPGGTAKPSSDPAPYRDQYAVDAMNLSCAQNVSSGSGTVVAVLDTGAQLDHPELAGSFTQERYDFIEDDGVPEDEPNDRDDDGDGAVDEVTGHGTHVSGIAHLTAPEARIMPLRVLDSDGRGNIFVIAEAFEYAERNGADVVNMSLGSSRKSALLGDVTGSEEDGGGSEGGEGDASVGSGGTDMVVVASAGNDNTNALRYPAAEKGTIAVASVDDQEQKSSFSNYGAWIDIAAPGSEIYSPYPRGIYATWDGTSMAAPFVAGQAALLRSDDPSLTPASVENRIESTARPLGGGLGAGHADAGASLDCGVPNILTPLGSPEL
ncbi:MAG: hypothetical protein CYG60_07875 [Actinobacteria bacterium]|nr:MAG: hypothetical protein CYG60_07875 [Actinomycetota bacterium]